MIMQRKSYSNRSSRKSNKEKENVVMNQQEINKKQYEYWWMMIKLFYLFLLIAVILTPLPADGNNRDIQGSNIDEEDKIWTFTAGVEIDRSSGSEGSTYKKLNTDLNLDFGFIEADPEYTYIRDYQLKDNSNNTTNNSIYSQGLILTLHPEDNLDIDVEYNYLFGGSSYKSNDASADITCDLDPLSFTGGIDYNTEKYLIKSSVENRSYGLNFGSDYSLNREIELGLSLNRKNYTYINKKKSKNAGDTTIGGSVDYKPLKVFKVSLGFNVGLDDKQNALYGFNTGVRFKFFDYYKLFADYTYSNFPSKTKNTVTGRSSTQYSDKSLISAGLSVSY